MKTSALIHRIALALTVCGLTVLPLVATGAQQSTEKKVLRYAFRVAETGFDPVVLSDLYSRNITSVIFDAPLEFVFLERPARMRPNTAADMPTISADFTTFTFRIKPGIFFADDPAFKGSKRELTAADYVYSLKRHYDPQWKSPNLYILENAGIVGMSQLRKRLMDQKKPFDYDSVVEGLKTLDRYTFQIKLAGPDPRFVLQMTDGSVFGAVAREVVEFYGDKIAEHPVGTGPYRLSEWRRSSRITLTRNPNYRDVRYVEVPPANNPVLAAQVAQLQGQRLPMIDEVQISIIEEPQPRWLSFLNDEADVIEEVPNEFAGVAFPNNKLAPNLAKRGIRMVRSTRSDVALSYFGMENPVVGGYSPAKVALRRAIAMAVDIDREVRIVRRGQAVPAQGPISPEVFGYDPSFKSEMSEYDVGRAKALLDVYGYVDKNGDGWRDLPDGKPLLIEYTTQPDQSSRQLSELWQKNLTAIGIKVEFKTAKWPENLKASRAGKLMMWGVGWTNSLPDGDTFLALGYGPNKGGANHARFDLPAFNKLYEAQKVLPDGPDRLKLMQDAAKLMIAYMPYKVHVHRITTDLVQPWVKGYTRNLAVRDFWKYVDIDLQTLRERGGGAQ